MHVVENQRAMAGGRSWVENQDQGADPTDPSRWGGVSAKGSLKDPKFNEVMDNPHLAKWKQNVHKTLKEVSLASNQGGSRGGEGCGAPKVKLTPPPSERPSMAEPNFMAWSGAPLAPTPHEVKSTQLTNQVSGPRKNVVKLSYEVNASAEGEDLPTLTKLRPQVQLSGNRNPQQRGYTPVAGNQRSRVFSF